MSIFPWKRLPTDVQTKILSHLPLSALFPLQSLFPHSAPALISTVVTTLRPLHTAWRFAAIPVRNTPDYRTECSRRECDPLQFVQLERLVLTSAGLRILSNVIRYMTCIKVLHVDSNYIIALPASLVECVGLLLLDLSHNEIACFPDVVLRIPTLRHLVISHNPIEELPDEIAALSKLDTLSCYKCRLTTLPLPLVERVDCTESFSLNVASNRFPRGYLRGLCERFPNFKFRLAHVMIEDS